MIVEALLLDFKLAGGRKLQLFCVAARNYSSSSGAINCTVVDVFVFRQVVAQDRAKIKHCASTELLQPGVLCLFVSAKPCDTFT